MQRKFYNQEQKLNLRKQTAELLASENGTRILEYLNFVFADSVEADTTNANETFYRLGRASVIKELNVWVHNFINKKEDGAAKD